MSSEVPAAQLAVEIRNLGKCYRVYKQPADWLKQAIWGKRLNRPYGKDFWALQDFSLTIAKGEVIGIVGRNGSGKSTLLQMLAGTLSPTTGTINVQGRLGAMLELGSGMNPEFTGEENMLLIASLYGVDAAEFATRRDAIVAFAGIGDHLEQPVKTYSSGMAMRLAFAVTALVEPDVLIIDEALSVGDIGFQSKCFRRFNEMRERGTTIILVTHGMDNVVQLCNRAVLIDGGRLLLEGAPATIVNAYKKLMADETARQTAATKARVAAAVRTERPLHSYFPRSEAAQEFGTGQARIVDYGMMDEQGAPCHTIGNRKVLRIVNEVEFLADIRDPILTFTVRDLKGMDITGTNTWFLDQSPGICRAGERIRAIFTQVLDLHPGHYTLSFSVTESTEQGLQVHHRLYDVMHVEAISERRFVGLCDPRSKLELVRSPEAIGTQP